jgi:hypothetical protein
MQIGIGIPNAVPGATGPELLEWARRADRAGFSSLASIGAVSYPSYEELTLFAAAGAVTERIRFLTNVLLAPARSAAELAKSPFAGSLFEGLIASEVVKAQVNAGRRREIYYFRDEQGLEVDFVVPGRSGAISLIECKATHTPTPAMAAPMLRLRAAFAKQRGKSTRVDMQVVHLAPKATPPTDALAPGVRALPWRVFVDREL